MTINSYVTLEKLNRIIAFIQSQENFNKITPVDDHSEELLTLQKATLSSVHPEGEEMPILGFNVEIKSVSSRSDVKKTIHKIVNIIIE